MLNLSPGLQQVLSGLPFITRNATVPTTTPASTPLSMPTDLSSLIALLFSFSALRDWFKLMVIGGIFESCRRLFSFSWTKFMDSFWVTAQFSDDDCSYNWMMVWLSKQPSWAKAREIQVSTRQFGLNTMAVMVPGEHEDVASTAMGSRKLAYLPSFSTTYGFWYKNRWMTVRRTQQQTGYYGSTEETLQISILTRSHDILNSLLLDAKKSYMTAEQHNISIHISDSCNNWRLVATRPKRPLRSIVLDPGIKDLLMDDAKDFLGSKQWYADRGIPFRRGYLLYGAPGSGKTSMIHSMAGELGLDVYVICLSRSGLDDTALSELISELPERCIALMEDIDAAFHHGLTREADTPDPIPDPAKSADIPPNAPSSGRNQGSPASRLTLSGLLNALDGVGAQEGRILYATTNKYFALDPALCRPGRMDLHVEFKLASKYQAKELFRCFYLPADDASYDPNVVDDDGDGDDDDDEKESVDSGYDSIDRPVVPSTVALNRDSTILDKQPFKGDSHRSRYPPLTRRQVADLASSFSAKIPEREFSMASLQGYLMTYKTRPYEAVNEASKWVEKERADRIEKQKAANGPAAPTIAPTAAPTPEPLSSTVDPTPTMTRDPTLTHVAGAAAATPAS